jgi:hypothetical protein
MKLNRSPYFDDYTKDKNFLSILFQPAKTIQTRELTQLQTILSSQRSIYASHMFKNGALIDGHSIKKIQGYFLQLTEIANLSTLDLSQLRIKGVTSGAESIILYEDDINTRIIISPLNDINYVAGETIEYYNGLTKIANKHNHLSNTDFYDIIDLWMIPDSVYYVKDNFVDFSMKVIPVPDELNYKVGLDVIEQIIDSSIDSSLLDTAIDSTSYLAPGADRRQIRLNLVVRPIDFDSKQDFITLAVIENGEMTFALRDTDYGKFMDMLAERTYDESGNYTVNPFRISMREHLKNSNYTDGVYTVGEGGNSSKFIIELSSGKAYIKGYEVEKIASSRLIVNKSTDKIFSNIKGAFSDLSYIKIIPATNSAFYERITQENLFTNKKISVYDGAIVNNRASGNIIGEFYGVDTEFLANITGKGNVYKIFLVGLKMDPTKNFSQARSIEYAGDTVKFSATIWRDTSSSVPQVFNSNSTGLLWRITSNRLFDTTSNDVFVSVRKCVTLSLDSNGEATLTPTFDTDEGFEDYVYEKFIGGISAAGLFTAIDLRDKCIISEDKSTLTINVGNTHANKDFILYYSIFKKLIRKTKTKNQTIEENLELDSNVIQLSCTDLYQIISIINDTTGEDVTDHFEYIPSNYSYNPCKLWSDGNVLNDSTFSVTYSYFTHSIGDFFDINSYSSISGITEETLPTFNNYSLGDYLDFRPIIENTDEITDIVLPMSNGIYSTSFDQYAPRIDTIVLNQDGEFQIRYGNPSIDPLPLDLDSNGKELDLFYIYQKANTRYINTDIQIKPIKNQRYTMKDIGELETRVKEEDEYVRFNLAEILLEASQNKDSNGVNRYKNGMAIDDFSIRNSSNMFENEYKSSLDIDNKVLRPSYGKFNIDFEIDKPKCSSMIKFIGNTALIDYNEEEFIKQPYATRHIVTTPYIRNVVKGVVNLLPSFDVWEDINNLPINESVIYGSWNKSSKSRFKPISFLRSMTIQFFASGLKPQTKLSVFFDDIDVSEYCRPLDITKNYGDIILSDEYGNCIGEFLIPKQKFFTGEKLFKLVSDDSSTFAEKIYYATGHSYNEQEIFNNVVEKEDIRILQNPIAQSFFVEDSCFITSINLFFKKKAFNDIIFIRLQGITEGFPNNNILAEKLIRSEDIIISDDASKPTLCTFNYPVYLEGNKDYAIIVGSNQDETRIWINHVGGKDIASNAITNTQPNINSLYRYQSFNWEKNNEEVLKFSLNRARFKSQILTVAMKSKPFEDDKIEIDPFETQDGIRRIRIHCPNHAFSVGDTIKPQIEVNSYLSLLLTSTNSPVIGQIITTDTGSGIITEVTLGTDGFTLVKMKNITGYFQTGQSFTTNVLNNQLIDSSFIESFINRKIDPIIVPKAYGKINEDLIPIFNGIPIDLLNEDLIVREVDSMNSIIIEVKTNASIAGSTGGNVILNSNKRYDAFNLHGMWSAHGTEYTWSFQGIGTSIYNDYFYRDNYIRQPEIIIDRFDEDITLLKPFKIANKINEIRNLNSSRNVLLTGTFMSPNTLLSPMINTETFSMTGIYNKVSLINTTKYNVTPNSNRFISELDPQLGSNEAKYTTGDITLQNPALDLKLFLSIHKPQDSDFDIYIKTRQPWNSTSLLELPWIKIEGIKKDFICSEENEYKEISFMLSDLLPSLYGDTEFNVFKIKIVNQGVNTAQPVLFKSLKLIALT